MGARWIGRERAIEGSFAVHALEHWLKRNEGQPALMVKWMGKPVVKQNAGQKNMGIGCRQAWARIKPELIRRGVRVEEL